MPTFKNEVTQANQVAIVGIRKKHHGVAGESIDAGASVIGVSSRIGRRAAGAASTTSNRRTSSTTGRGTMCN